MDELDIYDDLDEFHEQEEKKSKELVALEAQYADALKTIEAMKLEKKDLRKKIRIMEQNLQSLLDTAKAEIKRKDKIIEDLRREKDDLVFRRSRPQPKPNLLSRQTDQEEIKKEEITLDKNDHVKATHCNPFKSQPSILSKEEKSTAEKDNFSENTSSNLSLTTERETKGATNDFDAISADEFKEDSKNTPSERLLSKSMPVSKKQQERSYSIGTDELKDCNRFIKRYENKSKADRDHTRNRSRSRDNRTDDYKRLQKRSKDVSRDRSSSRNENESHSSRRKSHKFKPERHQSDDHSSYRKYNNEHKDRSGSSDRYEKSTRSSNTKRYSKKSSTQTRRERSPIKKEEHRKVDRHKSNQRNDTSRHSNDKSSSRKRRHRSESDENQLKSHHRSHKEEIVEKSCDSKRIAVEEGGSHAEKLGKVHDNSNTTNYSPTSPKENSPTYDDIHVKKSGEKEQIKFQTEDSIEEGELVEPSSKKNNSDQQMEIIKHIPQSEMNGKKTDFELKMNKNLENQNVNVLEQIVSNQRENKSTEQNEMEKKLEKPLHDINCSGLQPIEPNEPTNQQKKEQNSVEQKELFQPHSNPTLMVTGTREYKGGLKTIEIIDIDVNENIQRQLHVATGLGVECNILKKDLNTKSFQIDQLQSVRKTMDNFSNGNETIKYNSANENSQSTNESEAIILIESPSKPTNCTKNHNNSGKLALFETLFGSTASNETAATASNETVIIEKLFENVKGKLCNSNSSSPTTSPSLYTDDSDTSSKNSPKNINTAANRECKIEMFARETDGQTETTEKCCGVDNQCIESPVRKEEDPTEVQESLLRKYGESEVKFVSKLIIEAEKFDVAVDNSNIFSSFMDNDSTTENSSQKQLQICEENSIIIESNSSQSTHPEFDKDELCKKSLEHDLLTISLINISDDDETLPSAPMKSTEDKSLKKSIKLPSEVNHNNNPLSYNDKLIKELTEECVRLELASKCQSKNTQNTLERVAETERHAHDSSKLSKPDKLDSIIKAQTSNSDVIELDDEDESSFYNLTLSSDDDDETIANLQKKYKRSQKNKIEIIENIRLPTLFQPAVESNHMASPKNQIEATNNVGLNTNEDEIIGQSKKNEKLSENGVNSELKSSQEKEAYEKKSMDIIDLIEQSLRKSANERITMNNVAHFKTKEAKSNNVHENDEKNLKKVANDIPKCSVKKTFCQRKIDATEPALSASLKSKPLPKMEWSNDSLGGETKPNDISEIENLEYLGNLMKATEDTPTNLDNKTNEIVVGKLAKNASNNTSTNGVCSSTKDQTISGLSTNNDSEIEPNRDIDIDVPVFTKLENSNQKQETQKSKNYIHSDLERWKERRSLTEHNGKILQDNEKNRQCNATNEIFAENIQNTAFDSTPPQKTTANRLSSESSKMQTAIRKYSLKELRICIPRIATKIEMKATQTPVLLSKNSANNSPKNGCTNSFQTVTKRKRSKSVEFIPNKRNSSRMSTSQELSSTAELKAMLIDGKSPKMTQKNHSKEVASPLNSTQDTKLDEIDMNMQAIFDSPAKLNLSSMNGASCCNSTMLDITIDETPNMESSTISENLKQTDSSFEIKRLSLGKTEYVYEKVSEDVVNLFITRRRTKKRAKLDNFVATK